MCVFVCVCVCVSGCWPLGAHGRRRSGAGDWQKVREVAHLLKGAASNAAASGVMELSDRICRRLRQGSHDVAAVLEQLREHWENHKRAMDEMLISIEVGQATRSGSVTPSSGMGTNSAASPASIEGGVSRDI
jgi:hypothetical protein